MKKNNFNEIVLKYRKKDKVLHSFYSFLLIGLEIVIGVVLGLIIGLFIDNYLSTKPAFTISLILIGFLSGFRRIFKE